MLRRRFMTHNIARAAGCLMLLAMPFAAVQAQPLSNKPIHIIVPFGAGGVADVTARVVAQQLTTQMGQPVIIENKPSAGGIVAADTVVRSAPDGHTLFLMSNGSAVTANIFEKLPFDMVKDLAPISTLGYFDIGVVTDASSKFQGIGDVVTFARANPGVLNIGSINVGSTQNLAAELLKSSTGIDAQVIPFNGTPAVVTALRGKQVDIAVEILAPITGQIQAGAVKLLGVASAERSKLLPNVPTAQEQGANGFVATSWNALAAPAQTPPELMERLHHEIAKAVSNPEVVAKLQGLNVQAQSSTPAQTSALLKSEIKRWGEVIDKAGIPKQ